MIETLRRIVQEVNAADSLEMTLGIIVSRVKSAMNTEVCSVYLTDKGTDRLVLSATQGLNSDQVGITSLSDGEGLVGLVAARGETLNLEHAQSHPSFLFIPELREESFKAFLGVPIMHQRRILGVLVVQQIANRRFDESEEAFLITLSAQLAGVIAHTQVAAALRRQSKSDSMAPAWVRGIASSPGIAVGTAVVMSLAADMALVPYRKVANRRAELRSFRVALSRVRKDIEEVSKSLSTELSSEDHALFDVYLGILDDSALGGKVAMLIKSGQWAQGALSQVMLDHIKHFERIEHSYLRERAVDVKDLGSRVLAYLQEEDQEQKIFPDKTILVSEELTASMLGEVPREKLAGLVSVNGSGNSHVAILARAMGVPTVMGALDLPLSSLDGWSLIVDGYQGLIYPNADSKTLLRFQALVDRDMAVQKELAPLKDLPSETLDGYALTLWANTGLTLDVDHAINSGAEGVGLYRTEVPFLLRESFPSEEEQRKIYREQLEAFAPKPVTMRTLDVGGDKPLPYLPIEEENPFLGWRGIRVTLDHPEIFISQLRAMLKANDGLGNLRIMLPMVTNPAELDEAMARLFRSNQEIISEGWKSNLPPVGVMIEIPAAVYHARSLAKKVDFLSVGSNDLTQYLLAVDRNNPRVSQLYDHLDPAVLRALKIVAEAAREELKPVSICGELAGNPQATPILIAMGYDILSMNANSILPVKRTIRSLRLDDSKKLLYEILETDDSIAISERLNQVLSDNGLKEFIHSPFQY